MGPIGDSHAGRRVCAVAGIHGARLGCTDFASICLLLKLELCREMTTTFIIVFAALKNRDEKKF